MVLIGEVITILHCIGPRCSDPYGAACVRAPMLTAQVHAGQLDCCRDGLTTKASPEALRGMDCASHFHGFVNVFNESALLNACFVVRFGVRVGAA